MSAAPAAADTFDAQRGGAVKETSHAVRITLDDGFARYRVRRTFRNDGDYADEIALTMELPPGATADGLRVRYGGTWYAGELMDGERARNRFYELTDPLRVLAPGTKLAKRVPVLLEWESSGTISVRAVPVGKGDSISFEYTAVAPTCWGHGRQYLEYPSAGGARELVEPLIAVTTGKHGGKVTLHRPSAPAIEGVVCGDGIVNNGGAHTTIEIEPPAIEYAALRYGLYATKGGRFLARLDVDAAAELEPLPQRARVVFVFDGSWSAGDERLADQIALARGYLSHVPDAEVEVVVFRRYAQRLFGELVPADRFDDEIVSLPPRKRVLGNGSNVEQGVALAANLLSGTTGPARVVVFTDERTRNAFSNDLAIAAGSPLPRNAVLHVIDRTPSAGILNEYRDDDAPLAPLAAAFGGMLLHVDGDASDRAAAASTMLGVVRPIRIDEFSVSAGGVEFAVNEGEPLDEGDGRRSMILADVQPKQVVVTGKIWGRSWRQVLEPNAAVSGALPALAFGDEVQNLLNEDEARAAALDGAAVSPYTSYLAADERPVELPDEDAPVYGVLSGTCGGSCCGSYCTASHCGGVGYGTGRYVEPPHHDELLRAFMKTALDNCGRTAGVDEFTARLVVEATGTEIVDVSVEGDVDAPLRECLVDGAWDIRLSSEFDKVHQSYTAGLYWSRG